MQILQKYFNLIVQSSFYLFIYTSNAQNIKFFDLIPNELSGDNNAGVLEKVVSDSNGIYILGHLPKKIPGVGNMAHGSWAMLEYDGNVKKSKLFIDEDIAQLPYLNEPLIKVNDSIYFTIFQIPNPSSNWLRQSIFKLNIWTGEILQRKLIYDTTKIKISSFVGFSEIKEGRFQLVLIDYTVDPRISYLFELDTALNVINSFKIPLVSLDLKWCRFVSRDSADNYELVIENKIKINGQQTGEGYLSYIKLNKNGSLLKEKKMPIEGNIFLGRADVFTILQNDDRSFVISASDWGPDSLNYQGMPLTFKTSPEFDSILWITTFYEYAQLLPDPGYIVHYMTKLIDNSGYVVCGEKLTSLFALPDYGILFKVSETGDSLWLRKYQPVGWDSLRAGFFRLAQISCTPYNTLAVAAYVSDRNNGYIRPWILHVDEHGCLIPGCNEPVNTKEILTGKEKAFLTFPNPIIANQFYLFSRISDHQNFLLTLTDLEGKIIKSTHLLPLESMQYIIDLPIEIQNGTYILSIAGKNYTQSEKLIISR